MSAKTQEIIASLDAVHPDVFGGNEVERLQVRAAARRLLARVESPYERAWGFCFEHPVVFAALQTCIDVGLWKSWNGVGGGEKTLDELVRMTTPTVDTNLLRKSIRLRSRRGLRMKWWDLLTWDVQVAFSVCWRLSTWLKRQEKTSSSQHPSRPPSAMRALKFAPRWKQRMYPIYYARCSFMFLID